MSRTHACLCGRRPAYRFRRADGSPRVSGKMRVRHKCPHGEWCVRGEREGDNWNEPKCSECRDERLMSRAGEEM